MKTRTTNRLLALLLSLCILLGILPLSGTLSVAAQNGDIPITEEYFPDANFRSWLRNPANIGSKGADGLLSPDDIAAIEQMDVVGAGAGNDPTGITDVTGIQFFTNLKSLNCYYHPELTRLDLSGLKSLETVNCSYNSLTELNVSGCENLTTLFVNNNQLTGLDLSTTPQIRYFIGNKQTRSLALLGSEAAGYTFSITLNNPGFSGGNEKYVSYESGILTSQSRSADSVLFKVETGANNQFLEGTFQLTYQDDIPVDESIFPDENFRNWLLDEANLNGAGKDSTLTQDELAAVTDMDISGLGIADLTGIQHFTSLKTLNCSNNNLLSLDAGKLTKLTSFGGDGQTVSRELTNKGSGDYILPIALNNPKFTGTNAVSYENGNLISRDNTVPAVEFTTDIGLSDKKLSGSLTLSYLDDYDGIMIQPSTFPDKNFRNWLLDEANLGGAGKDAQLTTAEIASITSITIKDSDITDLTGIRCFSALEELSFTGMDALKFLDVSGLTKLKTLTCSNTGVKTVDIGGCASLNRLTCDDNPNLTELTLYALTSTEQNGLTKLEYLSCARNSLTKLDIFRCWSLKELDCSGNRLSNLKLMSNTQRHSLDDQTVTLTLAGNKKDGYSLPVELNNPTFNGGSANDFSYENGILKSTNLKADTVDFSVITNNREQSYPRLTGTLKLSYQEYHADEAEILIDENHFPDPAFRAWILNPDNLNSAGTDGVLTQPEIAAVKSIDVSNLGIADLTGIRQFTSLQTLNCSGNRLTSLDLTGLTDLTTCESGGQNVDLTLGANEPGSYVDRLKLHNPVFTGEKHQAFSYQYSMLKSTDNTAATVDFTADTGLAGKTLSGTMHMSYLEYIPIDEHRFPNPRFRYWLKNSANLNGIGLDGMLTPEEIASVTAIDFATSTILDITGIQYFTALESLKCVNNDIEALDVSGLSKLQELKCEHNPLTELVVSGCTELQTLWCFDSKLTSLDLSDNPKLVSLWLGGQETSLTLALTGSAKNGYSLPIKLNNPDFTGTDAVSYESGVLKSTDKSVDTVKLSVETEHGSRLKVTLHLLYNETPTYTLTVKNGTGSGTYESGTQVNITADPLKGYTFGEWELTSGLGILADPTAAGTTFTVGESNATVTALYKDAEPPTGEVKVGTNSWKKFLDKITFGLFFKETQKVSITAADNSGEDVTIEYFLSAEPLTLEALKAKTEGWIAYNKFSVDSDQEFIVYARLTDKAGNVAYLSSDGIVLDKTPPVISGAQNGETYDKALNIVVTDKYLETVSVNRTARLMAPETQPVENNSSRFALTENGQYTIYARDKAGNETTADVTIAIPASSYVLTFDTDGGQPVPDVQTLNAGEKPGLVSDPAKEGYTFTGWYNLSDEKVNLDEFVMPETNVTLKAKWEKNETPPADYTLTVENGTGSGVYAAGQNVSISATVPEGKEFVRWELKSGSGTLQDAQSG